MTEPTSQQLQIARTQAERMLRDSATHYVNTDVISASGSTTESFAAQTIPLPCMVFMATGGKVISSEVGNMGGSKGLIASHNIRFKYDAAVSVGDKVVIGSSTYKIIADGDSDTNRILLSVGALRVAKQ